MCKPSFQPSLNPDEQELENSQTSASQLDHCAQLGSDSTRTSVPTGAQFNAHQLKGD